MTQTYEKGKLYDLPIIDLKPDPNQPRKSMDSQALEDLTESVRKKQERGMTTAYNAYRAKQQKGKTTRQKKDPNEPQPLFDMMDKTMTKIRIIDTSAWTNEEKTNFQTALTNLKTGIAKYLATPPSQPSKKLA